MYFLYVGVVVMRDEKDLNFGDKLRLAWYFDKPIDKIVLLISFIALVYSIIRIIFQGFW